MDDKRVTLFSGHFGSGKTNLAVWYALELRSRGHEVSLADLDIVNPYFRAKDNREVLERAGVRFISSAYAGTNVDTPALPAEAYTVTADRSRRAVIDVGGDDRGALALGRYAADIRKEGDYAVYCVVNFYRPLTATPRAALAVLREIEAAAQLPFTAIINNSNLGMETTAADIERTAPFADELCELANLPLAATTVRTETVDSVRLNGVLSIPTITHTGGYLWQE